jgi:hypothetical protein
MFNFRFELTCSKMPRKPNVKKKYYKWANESMRKAINAVMDGSLSIRGTSQLFCLPFTTPKTK